MRIILAGGRGFLGTALHKYFEEKKHTVLVLTRNPKQINEFAWNAKTLGPWANALENADVLINLNGKSVDCRYTESNKAEILASRIDSTQVLQEAIDLCKHPPKVWLNASSATIYDHAEQHLNTETAGIIGDDFSMNICKQWEARFFKKATPTIRKIALRTSIVLGRKGGAFPKMKLITKLGLGGHQGSGKQKISWLHEDDFCRAVEFLIENEKLDGVFNITSPKPVDNKSFMKLLRQKTNVPFGLPSPVFLLEIASFFMRTETELLLKSRNVFPQKLIDLGFDFKFKTAEQALEDLV